MQFTLKQIAELFDGEVVGDAETIITGVSGIKEAKPGDVTFLANSKYQSLVEQSKASGIITSRDIDCGSKPRIITENPSLAFSKVLDVVATEKIKHPKGIHPTAVVGEGVKLGENVAIGAHAVIDDEVVIGDNTIIYGLSYIGHRASIGRDCIIYPQVSIRDNMQIGNKVIIHSGTVIGSDGFGFAEVGGTQQKIPQIGIVVIEDDVEIGANATIDRARFDKTIIGRGTKIDNLVQIAHNVIMGKNCVIVAQNGIAGSVQLGDGVILAGQTGVAGHLSIGDGVIAGARSGITKSFPKGEKISGYPAKPHSESRKIIVCTHKLPGLYKKVRELEDKIKELEEKLEKDG